MPVKRSLQSSPPPSTPTHPKSKKARPTQSTHPLARATSIGGFDSSPPPPNQSGSSPNRGGGGGRSRSRSVSAGVGGGKGKGKEREREGELGEEEGGEGDAEDEEMLYSDDEFGMNQKANARQKEDLRVLLEHFDPGQMDRFEAYRRSGLAKANVRKLVNQVLQQSVSPSILTVVRGFSKVFVGEIVEKARAVANHPGPLTPADLREAHRLYLAEHEGAGAGGMNRKKLFVK